MSASLHMRKFVQKYTSNWMRFVKCFGLRRKLIQFADLALVSLVQLRVISLQCQRIEFGSAGCIAAYAYFTCSQLHHDFFTSRTNRNGHVLSSATSAVPLIFFCIAKDLLFSLYSAFFIQDTKNYLCICKRIAERKAFHKKNTCI